MTILVTGGAGYIGSHMVLALLDAGEEVVVLDDLSTGFAEAVPAPATFVRGDCGDADLVGLLLDTHKVEAIIHFAGSIVVPDSVADPLGYYLNNTVKSRSLIAAAVAAGVKRFVFSSSAAVYGEPASVPVAETVPAQPISPYGWSKLMTEVMLRDAGRAHGLAPAALRYFNVAGADPAGRAGQSSRVATHLIKIAAEAAVGARREVAVFGTDYPTPDGTCIRDYVHVADLCEAHLLALRHLETGGGPLTLNVGYGEGASVRTVIDTVRAVSGASFATRDAPRRAGDPPTLVAAAGRIREVLGWRPRFQHLPTIVGHALAWERRLAAGRAAVA